MNNNRSQNITNYNITTNATCVVGAALKATLLKQTQSTWERPKASGRCLYTAVQSRGCLSLCRTVCNVGGSDHVRDNIRGCVNILRHCICSYQFPGWVCQIFTAVLLLFTQYIHGVSKKQAKLFLLYNYVKLPPNPTIFGAKMANCLKLYEVQSISTSPNLCQCTTVLIADVPNCYIML